MQISKVFIGLFILLIAIGNVSASTINVTTDGDTNVQYLAPNTNYESWNNMWISLGIGQDGLGYIHWSESQFSSIPAGSTINSVILHYRYSASSTRNIYFSRVTGSWSSSTITWNNKPSDDGSNCCTTSIPANAGWDWGQTDISSIMNSEVNYWVNGVGSQYYGLKVTVQSGGTVELIQKPKEIYLEINYAPPPIKPTLDTIIQNNDGINVSWIPNNNGTYAITDSYNVSYAMDTDSWIWVNGTNPYYLKSLTFTDLYRDLHMDIWAYNNTNGMSATPLMVDVTYVGYTPTYGEFNLSRWDYDTGLYYPPEHETARQLTWGDTLQINYDSAYNDTRIKIVYPNGELYYFNDLEATGERVWFGAVTYPSGEYAVFYQGYSGSAWNDIATSSYTFHSGISPYGQFSKDYYTAGTDSTMDAFILSNSSDWYGSYVARFYDPDGIIVSQWGCVGDAYASCAIPTKVYYVLDDQSTPGIYTFKFYELDTDTVTHYMVQESALLTTDTASLYSVLSYNGFSEINGYVRDANGDPVTFEPVTISSATPLETDANGYYSAQHLNEGLKRIQMATNSTAYMPYDNTVYLNAYETQTVNITLTTYQAKGIDLGTQLAELAIGRLDVDSDGQYSELEYKRMGTKFFVVLAFGALVVLVIATYLSFKRVDYTMDKMYRDIKRARGKK